MAYRALRPGGQVWIVGKSNARMIQTAEEVFGEAEEFRRRGYSIIKATRADTRKYLSIEK
jgi:16S rRNA G1207 methylase RsmC